MRVKMVVAGVVLGMALSACSAAELGAEHPIDAAEYALQAVAAEDSEAVCDMLGSASEGALPEGQREQCLTWADGIAPNLSDDQRSELEGVTVDAVTLGGDGRARVLGGDYSGVSIPLSVDLVRSGDRWFVEDLTVGGEPGQ